MRNRTDIRVYFPNSDAGHDQAVQWIYDNIVSPADEIRRRRGLYVEQPMPPNPTMSTCRTSAGRHPRELPDIEHLLCNEDEMPHKRACFKDPNDSSRAYFLCDSSCVLINVKPATKDDSIVRDPHLLTEEWSCLQHEGIYEVDAVLPNPNNWREYYFFIGEQYALVNLVDNKIVLGLQITTSQWPSLRSVGYRKIDAVLPSPASSSNAYFFREQFYALVNVQPGTNNDKVVNGSKLIVTEWPSLLALGFTTIDAALGNPDNSDEAYFFKDLNYSLINVAPGSTNDTIVLGPQSVGDNWPSLREAFFY